MSAREPGNKNLITHVLTTHVNERDWGTFAEHFTEDLVLHAPLESAPSHGVAAVRGMFDNLIDEPFPDLRWEIKELIAEDDRVVGHYVMSGTHQGTFEGFPATGRTFAVEEVAIYRIVDDRIDEAWLMPDTIGVGSQLGLVPEGTPPKFMQRLLMRKQRRQDAEVQQ